MLIIFNILVYKIMSLLFALPQQTFLVYSLLLWIANIFFYFLCSNKFISRLQLRSCFVYLIIISFFFLSELPVYSQLLQLTLSTHRSNENVFFFLYFFRSSRSLNIALLLLNSTTNLFLVLTCLVLI